MWIPNIQVNVTDEHGMPIPNLDVCAISLARAGQINEIESTQTTDASGTAYFTIDEPCFFRPMLSTMLKARIRVQLLGAGGAGNLIKHAVVDQNGFGTHTTIQAAIDFVLTLYTSFDTERNGYCIHINPGGYGENINVVLAAGLQLILEAQGGRISSETGDTYAGVVVLDEPNPSTGSTITVSGYGRLILRNLYVTSGAGYPPIDVSIATQGGLRFENCLVETNNAKCFELHGDTLIMGIAAVDTMFLCLPPTGAGSIFGIYNGAIVDSDGHYNLTAEHCHFHASETIDIRGGNASFDHCSFLTRSGGSGALVKITDRSIYKPRVRIENSKFRLYNDGYYGIQVDGAAAVNFIGNDFIGNTGGAVGSREGIRVVDCKQAAIVGNTFKALYRGIYYAGTVEGVAAGYNSFADCTYDQAAGSSAYLDATSVIGPDAYVTITNHYTNIPSSALAGTHTILDGETHTDTVLAAVVAGAVIFGNATPKWDLLPIGADTTLFGKSAGLPAWVAQSYIDHGSISGLGDDDHAGYLLLAGRVAAQQDIAKSISVATYMRVGSATAPTNTTAGDLTAARMIIPDAAISATGSRLQVSVPAAEALAPGAAFTLARIESYLYPDGTSASGGVNALTVVNFVRPTASTGGTFRGVLLLASHDSGAFDLTGTLRGMDFAVRQAVGGTTVAVAEAVNADITCSAGTMTIARGFRTSLIGSGGTIPNIRHFAITVTSLPTTTGSHVGLYVPNLGGGSIAVAAGVVIERQASATTDNVGIWFNSDIAGQGAGIAWGTARDTNLYRSAANVLATDDSLYAALHARVGSVAAPTNTTAGDLTCVRLFVGDAAAVAGKEALITGDMQITGTLVIGTAPDYTVTNVTADRIYDADATTLDEIADVLGTLIADLTTMGLLQ